MKMQDKKVPAFSAGSEMAYPRGVEPPTYRSAIPVKKKWLPRLLYCLMFYSRRQTPLQGWSRVVLWKGGQYGGSAV